MNAVSQIAEACASALSLRASANAGSTRNSADHGSAEPKVASSRTPQRPLALAVRGHCYPIGTLYTAVDSPVYRGIHYLHVHRTPDRRIQKVVCRTSRREGAGSNRCPYPTGGDGQSGRRGAGRCRCQRDADRLWAGLPALCTRRGLELIVLLCGGDKRTQAADIKRAKTIAAELED